MKTNLHHATSSFVGRIADVDAIAERFEESRLVTIVGPGGIGKTRVALRFAESRLATYTAHGGGGVWFCDLSEAKSSGDIVSGVAAAMRAKVSEKEHDALDAAIARRGRVLVLLDNFDRLTEHADATVARWLRAAPSARFLVTSRVPLRVAGEQLWPLEPLAPDDAIELFARRARQVHPSFDVTRERDAVASIVDSIDRLPLAIELAAHRTALLSASQLRERLAQPLAILAGKSDVARHASMRTTVLDSFELLDAASKKLFAGCSLLRNGFTLDAAEAVLGDVVIPRGAVLDGLETLVRTSLARVSVEPNDAARYSFFETIRDVAEELAAREPWREAAMPRLAAYYAELARSGASLAHDLDNLLLAHAAAVDSGLASDAVAIALGLEPLLSARGLLRLSARLLGGAASALDAAHSSDHVARARIDLALGAAHRELGDSAVAIAALEHGLSLARASKDPALTAIALTRLGEISDVAGDTEIARRRYDEALALLRETPEDAARAEREAEAYMRLGHARRREGDLDGARAAAREAITRYRELGRDEGLAFALYELAIVAMFAGAQDEAFAHFDEGLRVARRGDVRVVTGALTTARGCLLQDLGRLDEALEAHAEAARVFDEAGSRYREASALHYLATTYVERDEPADAVSILRRARERLEGVGATRYEALMAACLASALGAMGDSNGASDAIARAERAAASVKSEPALTTAVAIHRAALELRARRTSAKEELARAEALVAASPTDDSRFALRVLRAVASGARRDHDALVVAEDGASFRTPGAAESVQIPERSPLRRILAHLAARRIEAPGEVVTIDELIAVGWPSEKIATEAALNRAYVALASLRKMGLRGILVQGGGGYALSPAVAVRRENKAPLRSG
jgi:predicted ATPase